MRKILILFLVIVAANTSLAQNSNVIHQLEQRYGDKYSVRYDEGYYMICLSSTDSPDGNSKYGLCDADGKEILPVKYDMIYLIDGYIKVKLNQKCGIFDKKGNQLVSFRYDDVSWHQLDEYGYATVKNDKKKGIINSSGEELIPCIYEDIAVYNIKDGVFRAQKGGQVGAIDLKNNIIVPFEYGDVRAYQFKDANYCEVVVNDKVGVVDNNGKLIVPCKFNKIYSFQLQKVGYCQVFDNNGHVGIYDKNGQEIIPVGRYQHFKTFSGRNIAAVVNGAEYTESYYDNRHTWVKGTVSRNGKWGLVDLLEGKELVPCKYDDIGYLGEDIAAFNTGGIKKESIDDLPIGGKWGYISLDGVELIPAQYDQVSAFKDGVAQVHANGIASIISNPKKGSSLRIANGGNNIIIDENIPSVSSSQEDVFAFIIANENYYSFECGSKYSIHDGKIFTEYCKKTLGIPGRNVKYYEDATYGNMLSAISKIEEIASVYDGDAKFIVYYSGLGAYSDQDLKRYLLPVDASMQLLQSTGIEMTGFIDRLSAVNSAFSLVIIDAPFGNHDRFGNTLTLERGVQRSIKMLPYRGNLAYIDASGTDGIAYASQDYAHGLLTYAILKHIQETMGDCSILEICEQAKEWVKKKSFALFDKVQEPKYELGPKSNTKINSL